MAPKDDDKANIQPKDEPVEYEEDSDLQKLQYDVESSP